MVGGPSDIFVIFGIRHFLFLNCDAMKTRFKNHDWNVFHEARRRKIYRAGSKSCISTKMKKKVWSGRRYMNGVLDRLQIDETSRTAYQRNKNEELTDNHLLLYASFLKDSDISALNFLAMSRRKGPWVFPQWLFIFITSWLLNRCCVIVEGKQVPCFLE